MRKRSCLFALTAAALTLPAQADLITVAGTFEISASTIEYVEVGDLYHFSFTFDDSIPDTDTSGFGTYANALSGFSLVADAGNSGSWTTTGGTFSLPTSLQNNDFPNVYGTRSISGSGFAEMAPGEDFLLATLMIGSTTPFIDSSGTGKTFAEATGGIDLTDPGLYDTSLISMLSGNGSSFAAGTLVSIGAVPEPATASLALMGAGGLLGLRRRRVTV